MQIKEAGFNYMTFKNGMDPLQEKWENWKLCRSFLDS